MNLKRLFSFKIKADLIHLIFPNHCLICLNEIVTQASICSVCISSLNRTNFNTAIGSTLMDKLFWGRCQVNHTYAHLFFQKNSITQEIVHQIKYKSNKKLAIEMGSHIAEVLSESEFFKTIDLLIPIPLHAKKSYIRGYNQSELICEGISKISGIPISNRFVKRTVFSDSQTVNSKHNRWNNVKGVFEIDQKIANDFVHLALVDDVVTTGATIESLTNTIKAHFPLVKISIISLAIAK